MSISALSTITFFSLLLSFLWLSPSPTYAQVNSNYYLNNPVGIGTNTPNGQLNIAGGGPTWTSNGWQKGLRLDGISAIELGGGSSSLWGIGNSGGILYFFDTSSEGTGAAANYRMVLTTTSLNLSGGINASALTDRENSSYYVDPSSVSQFNYQYRTYGFNGPEYDANNSGYFIDPGGSSTLYHTVTSYGYRTYAFNGAEYDVNNTSYYVDPNTSSVFNIVNAGYSYRVYGFNGPEYDANNSGYYVDPNGNTQLYIAYRTYGYNGPEYDGNNGGYYVDPNATSQFYVSYRTYGFNGPEYDVNNSGYYVDPSSTSSFYNTYTSYAYRTHGYNGVEYDVNNIGYYLDPDQFSNVNVLYRRYGFNGPEYDINHTGYYLDPNGTSSMNVLYTSGGVVYNSDERLKTNITPITSALSKISQLKGVNFDYKQDTDIGVDLPKERQIGLIAQDVEKVFPEIVTTGDKGYKSVDYAKLTAALVSGMNEQQAQLDEQKKKNEDQDKQIQELKKEMEALKQKIK